MQKSVSTMQYIHWDECKIKGDYSQVLLIQQKHQEDERCTGASAMFSSFVTQ